MNVNAEQNPQNIAFMTDSIADTTGGKWLNEKVKKFWGDWKGLLFVVCCLQKK
jgi:hypothetical protein